MVRAMLIAGLVAVGSCGGTEPAPALDSLRQPSGLAISPNAQWLFVTNGNWDRAQAGGTLAALNLVGLHAALEAEVASAGSELLSGRPCRRVADTDETVECLAQAFIDAEETVIFGDGLGNIAVDSRGAEAAGGPYRLLLPQRAPAALAWVDVVPDAEGITFDCGQDDFGVCDDAHQLRRSVDGGTGIGPDPSRITLDDQGLRLAYLPHLLDGEFTLISLDGELGPEITAQSKNTFYREDEFDEFDAAGGFSVVPRACDPLSPAAATIDCERPLLYTTHRYWPGIKSFTVQLDRDPVFPGDDTRIAAIGADNVVARPIMGDLAFEDPTVGDRLLLVQTTPGALARVDTSIDPESESPRNTPLGSVALCSNPNVLAVHRPQNEEALALVSCFSDGVVAVVGLATFTVVRRIIVGEGPNEMVIDTTRAQLYVANSREGTISVVSLDRQSPLFLREWARVGVGAGSRDDG